MSSQKKKIDFNNSDDMSSIVSQIASEKTGKKMNINMKLVGVLAAYFIVTGLISNIYFLVKLILYIF